MPRLSLNDPAPFYPDKKQGGLRLDRLESLLKVLESGHAAVVPGNLDTSEIIRRITSDDSDEVMPPKGGPLGWGWQ